MALIAKGDPATAGKSKTRSPLSKPAKLTRRASVDERQRARDLVDTFDLEGDVEPLLLALRHFAEHGTFAEVVDMRPALARKMFRTMKGATHTDKVAAVAEHLNVSTSTVERWVRKR